jgi:protein SCO1
VNEKRRMYVILSAAAVLALRAFAPAPASAIAPPAALSKVGFDQHLDWQIPLDATFTDENGRAVKLGDYFGRKPVILVLAYYRCPMLCTLVLNGLVQALREVPFDVGREFNVLTVSFDPRETTALAAAKKKSYISSYGRPGAAAGWHFLTGRQESIARLTAAAGFRYVYDAKADQYIHTSGIILLTPQGKISRYFYDIHFAPRDVRLGLVEASVNRIGSPVDQVLLYCFHYDPAIGRYSATILNLARLVGVLSIAAVAGMVWILARRGRQNALWSAVTCHRFLEEAKVGDNQKAVTSPRTPKDGGPP